MSDNFTRSYVLVTVLSQRHGSTVASLYKKSRLQVTCDYVGKDLQLLLFPHGIWRPRC